jgi:hypothetical protein
VPGSSDRLLAGLAVVTPILTFYSLPRRTRIAPSGANATARLVDQVPAWTGNQIQLVEHSIASFAELVRTRNHLVTAIREDGIALTPTTPLLLRPAA